VGKSIESPKEGCILRYKSSGLIILIGLYFASLFLSSDVAYGLEFEKQFTVIGLELNASADTLTLLENIALTATVTPTSLNITNYKFDIRRTTSPNWFTISTGSQNTFSGPVRVAGNFLIQVTATIDNIEYTSQTKPMHIQFPSYNDIISDSDVLVHTLAGWQNTINATTPTTRREEGFWIRINTQTRKYEFTPTITGPVVGNAEGASVDLGDRPADTSMNPAPLDSPTYTVASFHTHTPTTFRLVGRPVGPSLADHAAEISRDVVGVLFDYIAVSGEEIPAGHPLNSPATRYHSGPNRRSTP
jgi:hypothetical protein